jgi:putative ABC transport system substrate-binding protein
MLSKKGLREAANRYYLNSIGSAYLYPLSDTRAGIVRPFADGLRQLGYVDGDNLVLLRRSAEGVVGRGADIASVLIREGVDVIVVTTLTLAKEMTSVTTTVPIVMAAGGDPIAAGVAASLSRPGGNVTGFSIQAEPELHAKRLQFLKDAALNILTLHS